MRIGIISDTHGDGAAWEQALANCFRNVDMIVHAGDVLYHGPRNPIVATYAPKDLATLIKEAPVPLLIARGNCDAEVDSMVLNLPLMEQVVVQMGRRRLVAQHGHRLVAGDAEQLAAYYQADLWISGHTHVARLTASQGRLFVNPGSPSLPHSGPLGNIKTVALADEEGVKILAVATGEVLQEMAWPQK
ncbi:Phosphodiesterase YfcE [Moorella humiferrea]|uniref:phosphodiesterase n=1 Tax=Neomoorella humiferrea TaxID=676965 RepID=UPI0030CE832C